jgi:hypothetical protein
MRCLPALTALAAALLPACVSLERGDVYPDDRDTVWVAYFGNETFYRDVQFELTEELVNQILSSPGLHLSSKDEAEIHLTGRVLEVTQNVLAEDKQQDPTARSSAVTVEISVVDAKSGEVLKKRRLTEKGQSVPARGEDLTFARREAFRYLARDIVRELEEEF